MDGYSDTPSAYFPSDPPADAAEVTAAIGTDERRMHVRAYNHWVSLLGGRDYPSIEDLDPASISDFADHSVLLDFTAGRDNPATPYIGAAIRAECGLAKDVSHIDQVPGRSLLSRLTDHYLQIIANRAPIGFEAEFMNQRGEPICYRGILMPFSSDGDTIDFIYGVINWKSVEDDAKADLTIVPALPAGPPVPEPVAEAQPEPDAREHLSWEDGPLADVSEDDDAEIPVVAVDAGLADRLWAARESADICKQADGRSRAALYRALAMAFDFAVAARRVPEEYAEILDDAGVKAQARAPMTPIVKLVFGADYDKARLTEFAAALSYAERCQVQFGEFEHFLAKQDGGLKGMVAAERKARRPDSRPDGRGDKARAALRRNQPLDLAALDGDEEFVVLVARRTIGGGSGYEPVASLADPALAERVIRRAA